MLLVNTDVTYSENDRSDKHYDVSAVDSEQEESDNRKRCACDGNAQEASVIVLHGLFAPEIPDPGKLVEHHENERHSKDREPEVESLEVEIRKDQRRGRDDDLAASLKCQKDLILI